MKYITSICVLLVTGFICIIILACSSPRTFWLSEAMDFPPYDAKVLYEGEDISKSCSVFTGDARSIQVLMNASEVEDCIDLDKLPIEDKDRLMNLDWVDNRVVVAIIEYLDGGKVSYRKHEINGNDLTLHFVERKPGGCGSGKVIKKQYIFVVKVYVIESAGGSGNT